MAAKIISLQQDDGSWYASLLNPINFNVKKTIGTGFNTYALFWGMNNGLNDNVKTRPNVKKTWFALSSLIQVKGMRGFVKPLALHQIKLIQIQRKFMLQVLSFRQVQSCISLLNKTIR